MFASHSALKYLVDKPMLGGNMCHWLLLFQEFDFKIIVNPVHLNAGPNHLSWVETSEEPTNNEDGIPHAQLSKVGMIDDYYDKIVQFLVTGMAPEGFTTNQKK